MTQALAIRTDQTPTTSDPLQLWDEAVSRYLETRKGGPKGNTAKTYRRTLRAYRGFVLESGLSPWAGDVIIAYNKLQSGLRKVNGGDLADDTIAARLDHVQAFLRWAYGYNLTPITPEMVKDILDKPQVKQLSPRDIPDPREIKAMLEVAKSPREHALISFRLETVILSLSKDDILLKTALFDRLRVLVLLTTVVVLGENLPRQGVFFSSDSG